MSVEGATTIGSLVALTKRGHLRRYGVVGDAYSSRWSLTDAGRAILAAHGGES